LQALRIVLVPRTQRRDLRGEHRPCPFTAHSGTGQRQQQQANGTGEQHDGNGNAHATEQGMQNRDDGHDEVKRAGDRHVEKGEHRDAPACLRVSGQAKRPHDRENVGWNGNGHTAEEANPRCSWTRAAGRVGIAQPQLRGVSGPLTQGDRTHANRGSGQVAACLDNQQNQQQAGNGDRWRDRAAPRHRSAPAAGPAEPTPHERRRTAPASSPSFRTGACRSLYGKSLVVVSYRASCGYTASLRHPGEQSPHSQSGDQRQAGHPRRGAAAAGGQSAARSGLRHR